MLLAMLMIFSMAAITVGAEGEPAAEAEAASKGIYEIPDGATTVTIQDRHGNDQEYIVVRTFQEMIAAVNAANEEVVTEAVMGTDENGNEVQTGVKITNEMTCRIILANDLDCENEVFDRAPLRLYRITSWAKDPLKPDELTYVSDDELATYIFEGNGFTLKNLSVINPTQTKTDNGTSPNAIYYEDIEASIFGCLQKNSVEITNMNFGTESSWIKISSTHDYSVRHYDGVLFQRARTGSSMYLKNLNIYADLEVNTAQGFGGICGTATSKVWCYDINIYGSLINRNKSDAGAGIGDQGGFFGNLGGQLDDGYAYTHLFENCNNYATVEATNNAGGFGGYWGGREDFINCRNYGQLTTITGTDTNINAGGFVAHVDNPIANPTDSAEKPNSEGKTYQKSYDVNGVHFNQIYYLNCLNLGPITGGSGRTGGFQGCDRRENIYENCMNYGIITGSAWSAGFAGFTNNYAGVTDIYATYINCINYGRVIASGNNQGGFLGSAGNGGYFRNCMNVGEIIQSGVSEGDHIGGFVGYAPGGSPLLAENCTNIGTITANGLGGGKSGFFALAQSVTKMENCYQFGYLTAADPKTTDGSFGHFYGDARSAGALLMEGSSISNNYAIANDYSIANGISKINEYAVNPIADGETVSSTYVTPEKAVEMLNERYATMGLLFRINEETGMPALASPDIRAVQHTTPDDNNKQSIRLIGNLYSLDYKSAGFKVVVSYKDADGQVVTGEEVTLTTSKVYKTITARDSDGVLTNYSADKMLGVYLYALTIRDVPTNVGDVTITVTPIATIDDNGTDKLFTGKAYVITYNNGEFVSNTAYVAPVA